MKGTKDFKEVIQEHLNYRGFRYPLFKEALANPKKNIDDCVTYILNTVEKAGKHGFTDDEVFDMAVHYYDEDEIEIGGQVDGVKVISNRTVHLTEEDIAEAKQKAIEEVIAEEKAKLRKKPSVKKDESKIKATGTLF